MDLAEINEAGLSRAEYSQKELHEWANEAEALGARGVRGAQQYRAHANKIKECARLREALDCLVCIVGLTPIRPGREMDVLQEAVSNAIVVLRTAAIAESEGD